MRKEMTTYKHRTMNITTLNTLLEECANKAGLSYISGEYSTFTNYEGSFPLLYLSPVNSIKNISNGIINVSFKIKLIIADRIDDFNTDSKTIINNIGALDERYNNFITLLENTTEFTLGSINDNYYYHYNETSFILNAISVDFTLNGYLTNNYCV